MPIHGAASLRYFDKTVDTMAICTAPICVFSFWVDFVLSHLVFTSFATIHECPVEDTFSFEKPVHPHRQGYLDLVTYGSYLNGEKIYLNSTLSRNHLHTVYFFNRSKAIYATMVPVWLTVKILSIWVFLFSATLSRKGPFYARINQ